MIPTLILCGGLATRLYPISEKIPKSLIEIHRKPFIKYQLDMLCENNVKEVVLTTGKFGNLIEKSIGHKYKNLNIQYSHDGNTPLGTGGAIKKTLSLLPDNFIVLYGDSYLQISFSKMLNKYKKERLPILMSIYRNKNKAHKNNISYNGETLCYDKKNPTSNMEYIDYGILIMNKSVFENYPKIFDLSDLLHNFSQKGLVSSIEASIPFQEVGSFKGIEKFRKFICKKNL